MKLMVIEKDYNFSEYLKKFLEVEDFECDVFSEFENGLRVYSHIHSKYDAIIVEPYVLDSNHFKIKVIEFIKQVSPEAKIIVSTACDASNAIIEAFEKGIYAYFIKPYGPKKLIKTLFRIYQEKDYQTMVFGEKDSAEKWCRLLFNSIQEPMWISNKSHCLVAANRCFYEFFEIDEKDALGMSLEELEKKAVIRQITSMDAGSSRSTERKIVQVEKKHNGNIWFEEFTVEILNENDVEGVGYILKKIDLDEESSPTVHDMFKFQEKEEISSSTTREKLGENICQAQPKIGPDRKCDIENFIKAYYSLFFKLNRAIQDNDPESVVSLITRIETLAKKARARNISDLILKLLNPFKNNNRQKVEDILNEINFEFENFKSDAVHLHNFKLFY